MPEAFGDVLYTPGTSQVAEVKPGDILAAYGAGILKKGVTIKGGQGLLVAGQVIARETATKKYVAYDTGGAGGAEVARGVLAEGVNTGTGTSPVGDMLGNIIYGGTLKLSKLTDLDGDAVTALNGRSDVERDWFIF
jgi:hypothetical protein